MLIRMTGDYWDLGLVVRVDPNISNTDQSKYFQVFTITYSYYIHPNFSISQKQKNYGRNYATIEAPQWTAAIFQYDVLHFFFV